MAVKSHKMAVRVKYKYTSKIIYIESITGRQLNIRLFYDIQRRGMLQSNKVVYNPLNWEPYNREYSVVKKERDNLLWTHSPLDRVVQAVARETWAYRQRNTTK